MTAPARFTQADLARAMKAAKSAGFEEIRVKVDLGGQIEVIVGKAANGDPAPLELE